MLTKTEPDVFDQADLTMTDDEFATTYGGIENGVEYLAHQALRHAAFVAHITVKAPEVVNDTLHKFFLRDDA